MSAPSGRSPFPSRNNRRRLSVAASEMDESSNNNSSSNFTPSPQLYMSSLLSQSRLSPASGWSPSSTRRRRFFEKDGGVLGTAIPPASMGNKPTNTADAPATTTTNGHCQPQDALPSTTKTNQMDGMNLVEIRALAKNALHGEGIASSSPRTAVFFASILYTKSPCLENAHLYAQALFQNGEYPRVVHILEKSGVYTHGTLEQRLEAVLLAATCLRTMGETTLASQLLETCIPIENNDHHHHDPEAAWQSLQQSIEKRHDKVLHPVARLLLLRGKLHEDTSNIARAAIFYKRALRIDPNTVEALELLLGKSMMSPQEAHDFISSLNIKMEWLRDFYLAQVPVAPEESSSVLQQLDHHDDDDDHHHHVPPTTPHFTADQSSIQIMTTPSSMWQQDHDHSTDENNRHEKMPAKISIHRQVSTAFGKLWTKYHLQKSPEALAVAALKSFRQYNVQDSLQYCQELTTLDPLLPTASFVYVATLVALGHKRLLFSLAHALVDASPKSPQAWFAVGSYYYACGRYHMSQRHYCRATRLDPTCVQAWIAFGCSFALCDESDQALASFRAAQRLAPCHHVPLLYMGMEYLRTNHLVLARHFLMAAHKSSGGDPLCLHELGVADYKRNEFATAAMWFHRALVAASQHDHDNHDSKTTADEDPVELCQDVFWEPTLFNLGQCYRKSRQFAEAERCFEKCLALCPGSASCFSALAFTKHLGGDIDGAIEVYHQALSRKPDDPLCSEMLNRALKEALSIPTPDSDDETVAFNSPTGNRLFSPSFHSLEDSDKKRQGYSARVRRYARRTGDLESESNGNPDLSLHDSDGDDDDDVEMSQAW